jgi:hypothetical protein
MKRNLLILVVGLLLAGALAGVAWAADQEPADPAAVRGWHDYVVHGTVTAIDGDRIAVETAEGDEAALVVGDETHYWVPGRPPTTTMTLSVGDPVLALGQPQSTGAPERVLAARLIVVAGTEELPRYVVRGQVLAVTQQTVVVQAGSRERAITVTPQTRLWAPGDGLQSLRDLQAGDEVLAIGQPTEWGQWIAGLLIAGPRRPSPGRGLQGEVTAIDLGAGSLTVATPRGDVTVVVDENTGYRVPGVEDPGLEDIAVGDRIAALGHYDREEGVFVARGIGVLPAPEES